MQDQSIELRTRLALEEARRRSLQQNREKASVEAALAAGRRPALSALDKFRRIKPTGSRDGFDP
jgi:hypothetical protein